MREYSRVCDNYCGCEIMANRMGLPEAGQEENLSNSHREMYVGWFAGIVFVTGGATAVVMYWLGKLSEWGVL